MDITRILASVIVVMRNFAYLVVSPYKTMRRIAEESDKGQVQGIVIFTVALGYFVYAQVIRHRTLHPLILSSTSILSILVFLITFILVTKFFHVFFRSRMFPSIKLPDNVYPRLVMTSAYSLIPTFVWFYTTSTLYYILPPPRTDSILGKGFSMAFIVFSLTLLLWRCVLLYLSLRFSTKYSFYNIVVGIGAFFLWFLPYSYILYRLHIFRIPFI